MFEYWWSAAPNFVTGVILAVLTIVWSILISGWGPTHRTTRTACGLVLAAMWCGCMVALAMGIRQVDSGLVVILAVIATAFATGGLLATNSLREEGRLIVDPNSTMVRFLLQTIGLEPADLEKMNLCSIAWVILAFAIIGLVVFIVWYVVCNILGVIVLTIYCLLAWFITGKSPLLYARKTVPKIEGFHIFGKRWVGAEWECRTIGKIPTSPAMWVAIAWLARVAIYWLAVLYMTAPLSTFVVGVTAALLGLITLNSPARKLVRHAFFTADKRNEPYWYQSYYRHALTREDVLATDVILEMKTDALKQVPRSIGERGVDATFRVSWACVTAPFKGILRLARSIKKTSSMSHETRTPSASSNCLGLPLVVLASLCKMTGIGTVRVIRELVSLVRSFKQKTCPMISVLPTEDQD